MYRLLECNSPCKVVGKTAILCMEYIGNAVSIYYTREIKHVPKSMRRLDMFGRAGWRPISFTNIGTWR